MISVIVPIYNVSKYLHQCIDSIINQTYNNLEIILVDDGSTDDSGTICDEYALADARIAVIHKKNGGLVSARKAGMRYAKGEYIGYVDGDDWIEPQMYEKLYQIISRFDVQIVLCDHFENNQNNLKMVHSCFEEGIYHKQDLINEIYPQMISRNKFYEQGVSAAVWGKLYKKDVIEEFQLEVDDRIIMGEDAACIYPCMLYVSSIYILHDCLYHYRQTMDSISKQKRDYPQERERFKVLYHTTLKKLRRYSHVYDVCRQWKEYVLFLMIPRVECIYKDYWQLDYLYPFSKVKKGSKVILYGAGTYGQRLYNNLTSTHFCEIVLWVDQNYKELSNMGFAVQSPEKIKLMDYDYIIVAITYAKPREEVYWMLSDQYGEEKISIVDETLLKSDVSMKALGLM
ncbi:MAG: glycosyltransferase family 2 protein [Lachnospira sp.]|nr:glycosyltransferase family 2 protein [Lachnospira sp.]